MDYGVTINGFVIKDLSTIQLEIQQEFLTAFGESLDVSATSVAGQLIMNLAKKYADIWELAQAVYQSFNPDTAVGVSLDNVSAMVGVIRLPAVSSQLWVILYGDENTLIPSNHLVRQALTGVQLYLLSSTLITHENACVIQIAITNVLDSHLYTVTVDSTVYSYTSDSSATEVEIRNGIEASFTGNIQGLYAVSYLVSGHWQIKIYSLDGETGHDMVLEANLDFVLIGTPAFYLTDNTGAIPLSIGTVTEIVNPITGLNAINNIAEGVLGRAVETDDAFRIRRRLSLTSRGAATEEAIRSRILTEVANVVDVSVISNRTDITDVDGRPPHSFEVIVTGGLDQEIAEKIWMVMPAGIETFGSITKTVIDSTGTSQTINFSRSTLVYIWVEVDIELDPEATYPAIGDSMIKDNIFNYALTNFTLGKDVYRQKLFGMVYQVPGIGDAAIRLGYSLTLTPTPAIIEQNVVIGANRIANFNLTRMTVAHI